MSLLHRLEKGHDDSPDFLFWCPGCKCGHGVWTTRPNNTRGAMWKFDGNMDRPTFQPSLLIKEEWDDCSKVPEEGWTEWKEDPRHKGTIVEGTRSREVRPEFKHLIVPHRKVCHVIVTNGILNYCGDSTHEFAGKSIPMQDF